MGLGSTGAAAVAPGRSPRMHRTRDRREHHWRGAGSVDRLQTGRVIADLESKSLNWSSSRGVDRDNDSFTGFISRVIRCQPNAFRGLGTGAYHSSKCQKDRKQ